MNNNHDCDDIADYSEDVMIGPVHRYRVVQRAYAIGCKQMPFMNGGNLPWSINLCIIDVHRTTVDPVNGLKQEYDEQCTINMLHTQRRWYRGS